ncbi:MAG TPA: hypothetical protein VGO91_03975 [Pyrinomonadaceae bacterium]|nr:hypothetical protein [Pyrinomonadaceae bacterium]
MMKGILGDDELTPVLDKIDLCRFAFAASCFPFCALCNHCG